MAAAGSDARMNGCGLPVVINFGSGILLSAVFGGLLVGLSMGLVVRVGGSTGGTDIIV